MSRIRLFATLIASAMWAFSGAALASPTNFSFAGAFGDDDDVQLFNFTADGASVVRLISYSYGGGTQANGNIVASGGFDPILALFDSAGNLIGQDDDAVSGTPGACGPGVVTLDPGTGQQWDTCFDALLGVGSYTVAIMQYDNFAVGPNLSNGFTYLLSPTFTAAFGCSNGQFCDVSGTAPFNNRTRGWAFDILNVEAATEVRVPEPSTLALLLCAGLAGLLMSRRRRSDAWSSVGFR